MIAAALAVAAALAAQDPPAAPAPAEPAPAPAPAPAAEGCKIVVLNLVGRALPKPDEDVPAILTETLAAEVEASSGCGVVSQADIVSMLDYEKQKAVCSDGSDSCLAEIGQALGADRVVAGTVGKLGSDYVLTARLMNVKKGAVEQRAEVPVSGAPEQLRRAAKNVGRRLFGRPDVGAGEKVDDSPLQKNGDGASSSGAGGGLLWAGVVVGGVGVATAVVAGALAALAEGKLADPTISGKDKTDFQTEGLVALGVAGAGAVVAVAGGVLVGVAFME